MSVDSGPTRQHPDLAWQRSSLCNNGACVESAVTADVVLLRDAKNADGPVLAFGHAAWRAFVTAVKHGFPAPADSAKRPGAGAPRAILPT